MDRDNLNKFRHPSSSGSSNSRNRILNARRLSLPAHAVMDRSRSERTPERFSDSSRASVSLNTSAADAEDPSQNKAGSSSSAAAKAKLVNLPKYIAKVALAKPFLDFELDELKPIKRGVLDLDARFFPTGLHPGSLVEVKGDEGVGKTLFITYLLARVVVSSPTKTAVLIDTTHHFNNRVLINMISHFDSEILFDRDDYSVEPAEIINSNPKLSSYLKRISTIKCFNAEQLLVTLGPGHESTIETMLLTDPNLSLVAVDTIDNYSFISSFKNCPESQHPNFLHLLSHAVAATRTPVICATTIPSSYQNANTSAKDTSQIDMQESERFDPSLTAEANTPISVAESQSLNENPPTPLLEEDPDWYSNIIMDYNLFTHIMYLQKIESDEDDKPIKYLRFAHLRSRHSPKTALFSVVNHRAKFSIFSDMLYVEG